MKVYASKGTFGEILRYGEGQRLSFGNEISEGRRIVIEPDEPIPVGDLTVRAFRTLHDASEPFGYHISSGNKRIVLITDTGSVTEDMLEYIADADLLVLESNHDTELLHRGRYPLFLKQRILSDYGHLSNVQAANVLLRLFDYFDKKRFVLLAHLSNENNTPAIAERTILTALARQNRYTGRDLYMGVLLRDEASLIYRC
jgi:phosphoribosyl 1,2-cyclic phosphodiesterase